MDVLCVSPAVSVLDTPPTMAFSRRFLMMVGLNPCFSAGQTHNRVRPVEKLDAPFLLVASVAGGTLRASRAGYSAISPQTYRAYASMTVRRSSK